MEYTFLLVVIAACELLRVLLAIAEHLDHRVLDTPCKPLTDIKGTVKRAFFTAKAQNPGSRGKRWLEDRTKEL